MKWKWCNASGAGDKLAKKWNVADAIGRKKMEWGVMESGENGKGVQRLGNGHGGGADGLNWNASAEDGVLGEGKNESA